MKSQFINQENILSFIVVLQVVSCGQFLNTEDSSQYLHNDSASTWDTDNGKIESKWFTLSSINRDNNHVKISSIELRNVVENETQGKVSVTDKKSRSTWPHIKHKKDNKVKRHVNMTVAILGESSDVGRQYLPIIASNGNTNNSSTSNNLIIEGNGNNIELITVGTAVIFDNPSTYFTVNSQFNINNINNINNSSTEMLSMDTISSTNRSNNGQTIEDSDTDSDTDCIFDEDENCNINHNETCVGDPLYCNLTYEQYSSLLYDYIYPTTSEWILIFSHTVVFVMGLVGNALVCIAVYTNYSMRTVTNIFIVNLAVADFFVILFCLPPTVVWDVTETWFMGKAMCKVVLYFQTVSVTVSVLTLTFISIDRWYAICFPLRYRTKISRAIASVAVIWIVALLSDMPEFLVLTTKKKTLRYGIDLFTQCETTWDKETEKNFYIARFMMLYTLPLLLMTIAYFKIVRVLWKSETIPGHRESRNHQYTCGYLRGSCVPSANTSTMGQLRARRKAAKMLVAVVVMFAGCYFPVHVLNILRFTTRVEQSDVVAVFSLFSHWLCYANSAVNPVIYNFMSGKFRREFHNALDKCRCARVRVEDRSLNHSQPPSRLNNVSPSTRSNYQLTSLRDITRDHLSRQHTVQTTFGDNNCGNGNSAMPMLNHSKSERVP